MPAAGSSSRGIAGVVEVGGAVVELELAFAQGDDEAVGLAGMEAVAGARQGEALALRVGPVEVEALLPGRVGAHLVELLVAFFDHAEELPGTEVERVAGVTPSHGGEHLVAALGLLHQDGGHHGDGEAGEDAAPVVAPAALPRRSRHAGLLQSLRW